MAKTTPPRHLAGCGHEHEGHTPRPYCKACVTRLRLNMQAENAHRRYLMAQRGPRLSYSISPTVRALVYERDAWTCQLCLDPVDPTLHVQDIWAATLDHIICRSWTTEPDHSPSNLRLAHRWCNSVRGDESVHAGDALMPTIAA